MEPPAPAAPPLSSTVAAAAAATAAAHPNNYTESIESSPRSRNADSWDEASFPYVPGSAPKLRLMCSYGGHIVPRPHDKSLCYVGGDTRIVVSDRQSSLSDLTHRLSKTLLNGKPFTLKYQLPNEDLDSLISVTTDEDLDNMIEEYDRFNLNAAVKSSRLRLFLFPSKPESIGSLLEDSKKSEDWFVNALNSSSSRGFSESASVNCLLGLDEEDVLGNSNSASAAAGKEVEVVKGGGVSVHSVPDSPMLETSSSFGSTSSSPSLANLPPIRVHVADDQKGEGIEEQFAHLGVVVGAPPPVSSPPSTTLLTTVAAVSGFSGEYSNRVLSDDERSGEGMVYGYGKLPQQSQPQPPQLQTKPTGGLDLPSLDSISSDSSLTNPLSLQRPLIYQESVIQNAFPVDSKLSEPNSGVQLQQFQDSRYLLSNQFDQQQQQLNQQQQHQLNHQQQQQLNQQHHQPLNQQHHQLSQQHYQQQQQQLNQHQQQLNQHQFLQAGTHYSHHHPSGPVPITSYYQLYPPQQQPLQQLDQHYHHPMYYLPTARHTQPYNFVVQQPNYNEDTITNSTSSHSQAPPPPSGMPMPPSSSYTASKPELATGMYRTATPAAPPLVQAPSAQHQQQYVGFSQIHHHRPSHSAAGNSGNPGTYAYEFVDPAQLYYPHPMAPQLDAQYQTMTSGPTMVLPESSTQLPTDNTKQQIRTSQP